MKQLLEIEKIRQKIFSNSKAMLDLDIQLERSLGSDESLKKAAEDYSRLYQQNQEKTDWINQKLQTIKSLQPAVYQKYVYFHIYVLQTMALHEKQATADSTRLFVINEEIENWKKINENKDLFIVCNTFYTSDHSQWVNNLWQDYFETKSRQAIPAITDLVEIEKNRQLLFQNNISQQRIKLQLAEANEQIQLLKENYDLLDAQKQELKQQIDQKLRVLKSVTPDLYDKYVFFQVKVLHTMKKAELKTNTKSERLAQINRQLEGWKSINANKDLFLVPDTLELADYAEWLTPLFQEYFKNAE